MARDDVDGRVREAMSESDRALLEELESEEGLAEMMAGTLRGRMRRWVVLMMVVAFVFQGMVFWCAWEVYSAETALDAVRWGALGLWFAIAVLGTKIWWWQEMHKHSVLREVKRLEVRVMRG